MSSENDWVIEAVGNFIHSRLWLAPIHTFIETNCLSFDYEDESDEGSNENKEKLDQENARALHSEQTKIYENYQLLVNTLMEAVGSEFGIEREQLRKACEIPKDGSGPGFIDECFEQLYAARNFSLFQEMMRRRNLILQLQALVTLQLQWGLLKPNENGDDLVLSLLLNATTPSGAMPSRASEAHSREEIPSTRRETGNVHRQTQREQERESDHDDDDDVEVVQTRAAPKPKKKVEPPKPEREVRQLGDLRRRPDLDAQWYRNLQSNSREEQSEGNQNTIEPGRQLSQVSGDVLREKLRELSIQTSLANPEAAAELNSRSKFLREQRDLLLEKRHAERKQAIEEESRSARPQSAAHAARRVMANMAESNSSATKKESQPSPEELAKRQALMMKLKRQVVDKH